MAGRKRHDQTHDGRSADGHRLKQPVDEQTIEAILKEMEILHSDAAPIVYGSISVVVMKRSAASCSIVTLNSACRLH